MTRVLEMDPKLGILVDKKHALVAPGQGNQTIGMGLDLMKRSKAAEAVWKESDEVLRRLHLDYNFSEFVWHGTINGVAFHEDPELAQKEANKVLTKTENAQPAVVIDSDARADALEEFGYFDEPDGSRPFFFAGNSLGFLTVLRRVGSLSRKNLAQLGLGRGEAFKYAIANTKPTTMLALDTEPEIIDEAKERFKLEICLINTDRQIMLGGPVEDIRQALDYLKNERGVRRAMSFEGIVDAAFHSKYMAPAEPLYRQIVYDIEINPPTNGVLVGASKRAKVLHTSDEIREELISQLTQTENWRDAMYDLRNQGVDMMTELNNTPRLTNMNIDMFGGERPVRLATPPTEEGDRGVTIGQRWFAKAA